MINISINESEPYVVTINGVRISLIVIPQLLKPKEDRLFSFRRQGDYLEVTEYQDAEAARRFYEKAK